MTRLIKLTDADGYTRQGQPGEMLWLPYGTRPPTLSGTVLCAAGVYHAYSSPEQAALMDPVHADLLAAGGKAYWAYVTAVAADDGTKVGVHELALIEPAELPVLSTAVRVRAAIYLAQSAHATPDDEWSGWAARWLSGEDRSAWAAEAAWAARAAAAAWAAVAAAAWAAVAAAAAAEAAVWAARAAAAGPIDIADAVRRAMEEEEET
jgi:hypothetical protein